MCDSAHAYLAVAEGCHTLATQWTQRTLKGAQMKPTIGRIVHYTNGQANDEGRMVVLPAMVIRTRDSTVPGITYSWDDNIPPSSFVEELPDDETVDLVVHGHNTSHRVYTVPKGTGARTWQWPPRV